MRRNEEGAVVLTDQEIEAVARYLAGRELQHATDLILRGDVPELSEGGHVALCEAITRIGRRLVATSDTVSIDARYVWEQIR